MSKAATKAQRARWEAIREGGCSVCGAWLAEIHHCLTGSGGRKDHDKVIALCFDHHRGKNGIHTIGRKVWQRLFGTEQEHLDRLGAV